MFLCVQPPVIVIAGSDASPSTAPSTAASSHSSVSRVVIYVSSAAGIALGIILGVVAALLISRWKRKRLIAAKVRALGTFRCRYVWVEANCARAPSSIWNAWKWAILLRPLPKSVVLPVRTPHAHAVLLQFGRGPMSKNPLDGRRQSGGMEMIDNSLYARSNRARPTWRSVTHAEEESVETQSPLFMPADPSAMKRASFKPTNSHAKLQGV